MYTGQPRKWTTQNGREKTITAAPVPQYSDDPEKSAVHGKHKDPKHPTHSVNPPAPPFLSLIPQAANN